MTLYRQDGTPATEAEILSIAAAIMSSRKKHHRGGRPKVMRKCKRCGARLSAREMWRHRCAVEAETEQIEREKAETERR